MEGRRQQGSQQKKKLSMGGGGGIGGSIRSPLVKRDQHSQVVIRGWLYKLEGALAMKQWKKRWFVLSDFCLFYYKDSDEEKLLGSILLPSYKINPCISEDRISKKFAFKAEHHNMKTYYFASDSKESMSQWMNAMSLATIMQKDTTCDVLAERGYGSPVLLDDEESGFSSYLPRRTPHHHSSTNPPSIAIMNNFNPDRHSRSHSGIVYPENLARSCEFENGYVEAEQKYSRSPGDGLVPRRQPGQPLYANAPPKPRRLTGTYHDQGAAGTDYPIEYSESRLSNYYPNNLQYRVPFSEQESLDYSSDWPPGMPYQDNYVYGSGYYPTSNHREANVRKETIEPIQNAHYHTGNPPRPHSADFLEKQSVVDPAYPQAVLSNQVKPRQRPKSSLEQYDRQHYWDDDTAPVSDHSHNYSYELVRENWSAHGLKRQSDYNIQTHALQNLDTSRSPNSSLYSESPSSTLRRSQPNMQGPVPIPFEYGLPDVPDHKTNFKSGVIENEPNLKDNEIPGLTKWPTMHPTKHPGYSVDPKFYSEREIVIRRPPHDHQTRPLSAEYKLGDPAYANNAHPNYQQQEQMMSDRDQKKVQLREESMKRLLEWKQRMLQSPLSRKYSPRSQPPGVDNSPRSSPSHSLGGRSNAQSHIPLETSPGTPTSPPARPPLPEEYRQKVLQDLENHEARLMMRENIIPPDSGPQHYGSYGPPSLLLKASDIGVENQPPYNNEIKLKTLEKSPPHIIAPVHPIKPAHSSLSAQQTLQTGDINISIESNDIPVFDTTCSFKGDSKSDSKNEIENSKYQSQMRNQDPRIKFPSSVNKLGQQQSYSSDDEGDSVVATSDEHLSHQRQRHLSEISKDNLNSSDSELHKQTSSKVKRLIQRSQGLSREGKRLSISAGDLLEKSHEELVLLLIQLRRTLARVAKTREKCHAQLESSQLINLTRLGSSDKTLQNYEELKVQIQELERQYDMTQPLVNLVENMVKLGSLYRGHEKKTLAASTAKLMSYTGKDQIYTPSQNLVEFSNNIVGSDTQPENFHQGISCLYELNRGFYAESANLMSLHQDKDMLEYTLDSVKGKVNSAGDNTMLVQKLKKQQLLLEKELTRVRNLLSHSAAKIEELTKENVKQEKDILLLKQKVHQALKKSSLDKMPLARANLESELSRVQSVIEELSQQRMEVVSSIENLKQESQHSISSRSYSLLGPPVRASPTGAAGVIPLPLRRKCQTTYLETDLDSLETRDLACIPSHIYFGQKSDNPLYVNTVEIIDDKLGNESTVESPPESEYYNKNSLMSLESAEADRMFDDFYNSQPNDINEADERMKRFYGIIPREKPSEIKTVRIVKRESERRSRVRKKVSYDENHSLVWLVEEPDTLLSEDGEETDDGVFQEPFQGGQNRPTTLFFPPQAQSSFPSAREQLFGGQTSVCSPSSSSSEFRTPITPLFLLNKPQYPPTSQATTTSTSSLDYRAPFKKAKRRHYTISGSQPTLEQSWIKNNIGGLRSRDDMDMERCLRTVNTPDIVRSTIKKVDVFDEKLIERELSLPQKIVIPERYIEAEPPEELSASEKLRRKLKAETIRKMLSETTTYEDIADENGPTETLRKKLEEEKKKRAHLLALNHTIAKEVMERSKMVAVVATLERLDPKKIREEAKRRRQLEEDIRSPDVPLPLRQQRENFLT